MGASIYKRVSTVGTSKRQLHQKVSEVKVVGHDGVSLGWMGHRDSRATRKGGQPGWVDNQDGRVTGMDRPPGWAGHLEMAGSHLSTS